MCYSISIITDYKNTNLISYNNELLKNIASNIPNSLIYNDYELSGTDNYIKTNSCSTIIEINSDDISAVNSIVSIIELIIHIKELAIEYIYNDNNIIYCSKKYLNNLDKNLHSSKDIIKKLEDNKKNNDYNTIYKALKIYKSLK
jgi:Fe2+ or Zn2+ uptake regulation protein